MRPAIRGALFGLTAAILFGLSAPLSKLLLDDTHPVLLAGLLYLGAALGLWTHRLFTPRTREAGLSRRDGPRLISMVTSGGIVAPVLMLFGLSRVSALTGSLLLNLEAPFTVLIALVFFKEHLGRAGIASVLCIVLGASILRVESGPLIIDLPGMGLLAAACACWAIDNNLTQKLSLKDPFALVRVKTLVAGTTNTILGLIIARALPAPKILVFALALGCVSYGVSVVLDAFALRLVGAAREAAYFATAPFIGALLSIALGESARWQDLTAMGLMICGVILLLREKHGHRHTHDALTHEHLHHHDAHHHHAHAPGVDASQPHSHEHTHESLTHDHPHVSDLHHRHTH